MGCKNLKHQGEHTFWPREQAIYRAEIRPYGGLSLFDELPVAPWEFSYITLALTLTPKNSNITRLCRGDRGFTMEIPVTELRLHRGLDELVEASHRLHEGSAKQPWWRWSIHKMDVLRRRHGAFVRP